MNTVKFDKLSGIAMLKLFARRWIL